MIKLNRLIIFYFCIFKWSAKGVYFKNIANIHVSTINIYHIAQVPSLIRCSYICGSNPIAECTRFMWSDDTQICMLHSEDQTGLPVVLPDDASWFVKKPSNLVCNTMNYDYDFFTRSCIRLVYNESGITWVQAQAFCKEDGGDLLSITTQIKKDFVFDYISNVTDVSAWVGLRLDKWVNGENVDENLFSDCQLNNNDSEIQDADMSCGRIRLMSSLRDSSCEIRKRYYYLCEIYS